MKYKKYGKIEITLQTKAGLITLALTAISLGCGIPSPLAPENKSYTIYLSNNFAGNDWRQQMLRTASIVVKMQPLAGRVVFNIVNVETTVQAQINSLTNIIRTRPDAILIDASSPTALNPTIEKACKAGILVIVFDQITTAEWAREENEGRWDIESGSAGLHASCLPWLRQHAIALLASNLASDLMPSQVDGVRLPIHLVTIAALGVPIIDNCDLERLGQYAAGQRRWEFLFVASPLAVPGDSTMSYPRNPHNPNGVDTLADEYVRAVGVGASICHLHGPYTVDATIGPDGNKLSDLDLDGWQRLKDSITARCMPIIQYGIANGRYPQRVESMKQHPDMMSICFNPHDECFQPDPNYPPVELCGIHSREELEGYCHETRKYGVKPEVESFHYGGIWNAFRLVEAGLLDTPVWTTFFLGWPGGCWTPPTVEAVQFVHDHKPENFNYSVSVMDPPGHWQVLTKSILLGGHVRLGMEDSPYLDGGRTFAKSNAELAEKIVRIAQELGREIASPAEARRITGLKPVKEVAASHSS